MTSFRLPSADDPIRPATSTTISIAVDGRPVAGLAGQTIAGVLLGAGTLAWRTTSKNARPRGVFCGIGICYDCLVEVNGKRDVRACQRRAADGDEVVTQYDELPEVVGGAGVAGVASALSGAPVANGVPAAPVSPVAKTAPGSPGSPGSLVPPSAQAGGDARV